MAVIFCYILGIFIGLPLFWWVTSKIGSKAEVGFGTHLLRIGLRSLALALAFAPTTGFAGFVAFVWPSSLVLINWFFLSAYDRMNLDVQNQVRTGVESLVFCWLLFSTIYAARFLYKKR